MRHKYFALVVAVGVLAGVRMSAHHSHAAAYFEDRKQTIEGVVVQVSIRNPHSWVQVDAKDPNGIVQRYAIEWASGIQLNRNGVTGKSLKAGDHVVITGHPGRNENDHRLEMLTIRRTSDGWKWGDAPGEVVG
jgi:hypothetical protein